ncbi:hypothetical protein APHWI1_0134 [Anaplasma phagocytophilum str. ApWI1]|uniref:Uncharacterized protein n=1 Tax=Anaplasma phagocytophilum str. ApWI1 TaxID=1359155 RepID=A0A0F3PZV4_ANAPH|nr:hypothetical protein APHWEB_1380 [Anaplasma phagocytophilum str. Webster]KJV85416.1 hypothetical protein APHWI1_0134 [Anaplasma phagocytophilum str. ApWI1]KJV87379.1 hypothetical protein APHNYW_0640 [Anaplasma phagocytophilum str. ApNYW]KJV98860.1 hypothetical protein OTSANNIE_0902 [Anaplasma phagocytophilum str. Annie]KJZ98045.1 hypothetical protein APHDU1_1445 [Anaplasma phagocytophilum]
MSSLSRVLFRQNEYLYQHLLWYLWCRILSGFKACSMKLVIFVREM